MTTTRTSRKPRSREPIESYLLSEHQLEDMYYYMLLARRLNERMLVLNRQGRAPFVIAGAGQEAAQVGAAMAMNKGQDYLAPYYRDLGMNLVLGMTAREAMLNLLGKRDDPNSHGKQMPSHWGNVERRILNGSSVVATQLLHATGIALAAKMKKDPIVAVTCCGEGSTSKGDFHEALNFASIHKLPVIFFVQNNGYAITESTAKSMAVPNVADRARGYNMQSAMVDGMDCIAVYQTVKPAIDQARRGGGPFLIEAKCYRLWAHSSDDDDSRYRPKAELEEWSKKDPVTTFRDRVESDGIFPREDLEEIEQRVEQEVRDAAQWAMMQPDPEPEDALTHVYKELFEMARMTVIEAVRSTLEEEMGNDDRIFLIGEDVEAGGVFRATEGLSKTFPGRVIDSPLAEASIVGIAIGAAHYGMRPVAEIQFADFIHSAFDHLVSEASRWSYRTNADAYLPLVVRTPWGGGVHGGQHHSQSIEAYYTHVPGLKVVTPSFPADYRSLLKASIADPNPVLFLEHKRTYRLIKQEMEGAPAETRLGKSRIARKGDDLTIYAYGLMLHESLAAAEELAKDGIECTVVDLLTLLPLDVETILEAAKATGKILVVHEDTLTSGFGGEIAALIAEHAFEYLDAPIRRLAAPDVPSMPYHHIMEDFFMPDKDKIAAAARDLAAY